MWRVWLALLALLWAPTTMAGRDLPAIPGTTWSYDPGEGWTEAEILALTELGERLPASYQEPEGGVRLLLRDAHPIGDGRGHTLARIHPTSPRIVLYTRGLSTQLEKSLLGQRFDDASGQARVASILLERAVIHELTHLVDRRGGLSRARAWREISGWNWWSRRIIPHTPHAQGEFAAPWGAHSPQEDLATFAEVYFSPPKLGPFDAEHAPQCKFPRKYRYLRDNLPPHGEPTPNVVCSNPSDGGLSPDQVGEIHILYATPTLSSASTIGGHILLAIEHPATDTWETFGLTVDTSGQPASGLETMLLATAGGYSFRLDRQPYETTRLRYVETENRDLLRYRWLLSPDEKRALLERLDDIFLHWSRPYLFLQQNCSALIVELARAVEDKRFPSPFVIAPDLVLSELSRRGSIEPIEPDPERDLAPITRARLLASEISELEKSACGGGGRSAGHNRARDRMYAALVEKADAEDCWRDVADVIAAAAPLDRALASIGSPMPSRDAALTGISARVPTDQRTASYREAAALTSDLYVQKRPRSKASQHTPYAPVTIGMAVDGLQSDPVPQLFVRRMLIDVVNGQPRRFPSAAGLDLRVLDTRIAATPSTRPQPNARFDFATFAYHGAPVAGGPGAMLRLDLLSSEVSFRHGRTWVQWGQADVGLTILQGLKRRSHLSISAGLDARSAFSAGPLTAPTWVGTPGTARAVVHTDGAVALGLDATFTALPAWGAGGAAFATMLQGDAWLYIGRFRSTGVKLAVGARTAQLTRGQLDLPAPGAQLGLRLERR